MVQRMIGDSAFRFQQKVERRDETIVGVNAYATEEDASAYKVLEYPQRERMQAQVARLKEFKSSRSSAAVSRALGELARAAQGDANVMEKVVSAAEAGATHGEICATLRRELGFGQPLTIV
jgi:methylmalonyl-CoA mutase N-terminal domain/subunit